jgi:hypothetical protein
MEALMPHRLYQQRCRKAARVAIAYLREDPPPTPDHAEQLERTRREVEIDDDELGQITVEGTR